MTNDNINLQQSLIASGMYTHKMMTTKNDRVPSKAQLERSKINAEKLEEFKAHTNNTPNLKAE